MMNPFLSGMLASGPYSPHGTSETALSGVEAGRAERAVDEVRQLEDRMDRLVLVNMALWSLLQEKTGLTEKDLMDRVQQVDLADGQLDGKARKPLARCPDCDRVMSPRHKRCLYCGADRLDYSAFDSAR